MLVIPRGLGVLNTKNLQIEQFHCQSHARLVRD